MNALILSNAWPQPSFCHCLLKGAWLLRAQALATAYYFKNYIIIATLTFFVEFAT